MKSHALELIQPVSKKDQVVTMLKAAILAGRIASGDQIVESRISGQLGVGTPLVRAALIELEHQGFVQKIPYKGTSVTRLSRRDIEQIFRLRVELEALAVEWAREQIKAEDIAALRLLIVGMRQGAKTLNLDRFYENDLAFHRKLWELSGNPYLVSTLERVVVPLFSFFLMKTSRNRQSYAASAGSHEKIVDALEKSSAAAARRLMKESLSGWKNEMLNRLFPEQE